MRKIFEHQKYLMDKIYKLGRDREALIENYRTTTLAAVDELMEALHHVPWKPWSNRTAWDWAELHKELVDVFTFFVQLCQLSGLGPEDLEKGYFEKARINQDRQESGTYGASPHRPGLSKRQLGSLREAAARGACTSARVGCLIMCADGHEAVGWNRAIDDIPCTHDPDSGCPGRTVHAEVMAAASAASQGHALRGSTVYVTQEPCARCRKVLETIGVADIQVVQL